MSSEVTSIEEKSNNSKNIITYSAILITFLIALWLSFQSEGPSKMPKVVTDEFTFTAWVNAVSYTHLTLPTNSRV